MNHDHIKSSIFSHSTDMNSTITIESKVVQVAKKHGEGKPEMSKQSSTHMSYPSNWSPFTLKVVINIGTCKWGGGPLIIYSTNKYERYIDHILLKKTLYSKLTCQNPTA